MGTPGSPGGADPMPSVLTVANIVYALHAFAIVVGIAGSATVIGSFIGSVPSIVAVNLNYVKPGAARGTWVESHYRWQIRTFWWWLAWALVGLALLVVVVGLVIWLVDAIWLIYRIVKGWVRLSEGKPMYEKQ